MKVITQDSTRTVPYEEMEMLIETPQLYLLTYGWKATLLQKKDLTGDAEAFAVDFERLQAERNTKRKIGKKIAIEDSR